MRANADANEAESCNSEQVSWKQQHIYISHISFLLLFTSYLIPTAMLRLKNYALKEINQSKSFILLYYSFFFFWGFFSSDMTFSVPQIDAEKKHSHTFIHEFP